MRDAIVIPGGGLRPDGGLPEWVEARFALALEGWQGEVFLPLSAGTTHRPLALSATGQPLFEAHMGADWLRARGVPEGLILPESASYDTIGNAFFARLLHTEPRGLRRLHVVSSAFHLARCRVIFDWVFGMDGGGYELSYAESFDVGLSAAALAARREKEAAGLVSVMALRERIGTLGELHRWLYTEHDAYRASRPAWGRAASGAWVDSY